VSVCFKDSLELLCVSRWSGHAVVPQSCLQAYSFLLMAQQDHGYRLVFTQSAVLLRQVICMSVLSVCDVHHICWNSSKIVSPLVSLRCSARSLQTPTSRIYSKGDTPEFSPECGLVLRLRGSPCA